jgi:hypothetical protein
MKGKNAWKLVKHEDYEECEHDWGITSASDQYVHAECHNCEYEIEWNLDVLHFVQNYFDLSEPVMKMCTECNCPDDECGCFKCPKCGEIEDTGDEDEHCWNCECEYCCDYHGCEVTKCTECGEETGCENYDGEEWDIAGMCEDCYAKSQMPEKEKKITEQIEGLQKKLIDMKKVE